MLNTNLQKKLSLKAVLQEFLNLDLTDDMFSEMKVEIEKSGPNIL